MTDMTNSETTKQPMLPDGRICVADQNDELLKDSVIDYVRKTDEEIRTDLQTDALAPSLSPIEQI